MFPNGREGAHGPSFSSTRTTEPVDHDNPLSSGLCLVNYQCISFMNNRYADKSLEEIRFAEYEERNRIMLRRQDIINRRRRSELKSRYKDTKNPTALPTNTGQGFNFTTPNIISTNFTTGTTSTTPGTSTPNSAVGFSFSNANIAPNSFGLGTGTSTPGAGFVYATPTTVPNTTFTFPPPSPKPAFSFTPISVPNNLTFGPPITPNPIVPFSFPTPPAGSATFGQTSASPFASVNSTPAPVNTSPFQAPAALATPSPLLFASPIQPQQIQSPATSFNPNMGQFGNVSQNINQNPITMDNGTYGKTFCASTLFEDVEDFGSPSLGRMHCNYQCIVLMPDFNEMKSFEELRFEDYQIPNVKLGTSVSVFNSNPPSIIHVHDPTFPPNHPRQYIYVTEFRELPPLGYAKDYLDRKLQQVKNKLKESIKKAEQDAKVLESNKLVAIEKVRGVRSYGLPTRWETLETQNSCVNKLVNFVACKINANLNPNDENDDIGPLLLNEMAKKVDQYTNGGCMYIGSKSECKSPRLIGDNSDDGHKRDGKDITLEFELLNDSDKRKESRATLKNWKRLDLATIKDILDKKPSNRKRSCLTAIKAGKPWSKKHSSAGPSDPDSDQDQNDIITTEFLVQEPIIDSCRPNPAQSQSIDANNNLKSQSAKGYRYFIPMKEARIKKPIAAPKLGTVLEEDEEAADADSYVYQSQNSVSSNVVLTQPEYYCKPSLAQLDELTDSVTRSCVVQNFEIGHTTFGKITFLGELNVAGMNVDRTIKFRHREVDVYFGDQPVPPIGVGLNRPCIITLYQMYPKIRQNDPGQSPTDESSNGEHFEFILRQACARCGHEFLNYDPSQATWTFKVPQFLQ